MIRSILPLRQIKQSKLIQSIQQFLTASIHTLAGIESKHRGPLRGYATISLCKQNLPSSYTSLFIGYTRVV